MFIDLIGKIINNVKIEKQLIKGSNKVFIGVDEKSKEKLAVKVIDIRGADTSVQKSIDAESKIGLILSKSCLFLVKIREVLTRSDFVFFFMEFCEEGDLAVEITKRIDQNKPFSDGEILEMMFQLGKGVEALHDGEIVHRDLNPNNIFIVKKDDSGIILKIGDFGICRNIESTQKKTTMMMGTLGYTPPEVLNGEGYSKAGDVYALGTIFLELVDLRHPFFNEGNVLQQGRIFTGQVNRERAGLSPLQKSLRNLGLQMMNLNLTQRPTVAAVLAFPAMADFVCRRYASLAFENHLLRKQLAALTQVQGQVQVRPVSVPVPEPVPAASAPFSQDLDLPIVLLPDPPVGGACYQNNRVKFVLGNQTICVGCDFQEGKIYVIDLILNGYAGFGLVKKKEFTRLMEKNFIREPGTCCLKEDGEITVDTRSAKYRALWKGLSGESVQTRMQLNTLFPHTLSFFVNGRQIPYVITRVPRDVLFAFCCYGGGQIYVRKYVDGVLALRAVTSSCADPNVKCKELVWEWE